MLPAAPTLGCVTDGPPVRTTDSPNYAYIRAQTTGSLLTPWPLHELTLLLLVTASSSSNRRRTCSPPPLSLRSYACSLPTLPNYSLLPKASWGHSLGPPPPMHFHPRPCLAQNSGPNCSLPSPPPAPGPGWEPRRELRTHTPPRAPYPTVRLHGCPQVLTF